VIAEQDGNLDTPGAGPADIASVLAVLANPVRLRILEALAGRRESVSELARRLDIGRPLLHMHLRRLEAVGLVHSAMEISPQGKAMRFYEVAPFDIHLTPATLAGAGSAVAGEPEPPVVAEPTAETGDA
jgi:DNA-binding transcriptional ArsR family regulator